MATIIKHKSGKTWKCETMEDWNNFHNDPLYDECDENFDSTFTFDGMSWSEYYKTIIEPEQLKNDPFDSFVFEDD